MANFSRTDLDFLFQQILIAEGDSAAQQGGTFDELPNLVSSPLLPEGLRNVNGSYNNLFPGQSLYGAADQLFPRLLTPNFLPAGPATFDVGPLIIGDPTSYLQTSGFVFDSKPRTVSNLIVDQTDNNPAAVAAAAATTGSVSDVDGKGTFFIPNATPDVGLSAPYNSWFTLFGQFFDHGLDLVNKGQSGTVFIPLEADDPLIPGPDGILGDDPLTFIDESLDDLPGLDGILIDNPETVEDESADNEPGPDGFLGDNPATFINEGLDDLPPNLQFMAVTRATNVFGPGPDGLMGTGDDTRDHVNQTTPFVDQNQTYTSHPSHQVFLREYETSLTGQTVATGKLLEGSATGDGLATWADIKAQAHSMLGINLTDADLTNLPLLATDTYGKFIPGANGFAQLVTDTGLVEYDPLLDGPLGVNVPANVVRTGHAFLDDIAHTAVPKFNLGVLNPDLDTDIGNAPAPGTYDNELLDAHFITGDGRGNENIGLTTVHTVFHAEHNRSVEFVKVMIDDAITAGDTGLSAQWKLPDGSWNGERLFQAARFATEMQYQHLVFEEFARKVQPNVDVFIGYDSTIDPAIMAEFAHVVYRFGHSMLTETVARTNVDGSANDIGLIEAFLNPVAFRGEGIDAYNNNIEAAAAVVNGMTAQVGNELDEFVTGALRNNLVGLPLDLAAINIARGRDTGIPGLNDARRMFYEDTGQNSALQPYESWADFGANIRHPESLTNFVAAYGTHPSILAATTLDDKRAAADLLVNDGSGASGDRDDFMNSTGAWANTLLGEVITGLDDVDFWIGGLAENQALFGGLLGSTFNFVFETQMESLQDADRLYYLSRTAGLDFLTELEANSFSELIMLNLPDVKHLPFDSFSTPTHTFEMSAQNPSGPIIDDQATSYDETELLIRDTSIGANTVRYNGEDHIVMGGTGGVDRMRAGDGDDTLWGDGGNDRLEGGAGNDSLNGGAGNDIISDSFGDDNIKGGDGHDTINGGPGLNLILAGAGSDFVTTGNDSSEVFAGAGNDFIFGNNANAAMLGNAGHDWIQNGAGGATGDNADPLGNDSIRGNDVFYGGNNIDDFAGEGGDDIMSGLGGQNRSDGDSGFDWTISDGRTSANDIDLARLVLPGPFVPIVDRYNFVEAASGWNFNDIIRGDDKTFLELELIDPITGQNNALDEVNGTGQVGHSAADRIAQITGLSAVLGGANAFSAGNILLGGGGSDTFEGRAGDDILDGDAWLDIRIKADNGVNPPVFYENMTSVLRTAMQNGVYSPDQLSIVREIKTTASVGDVALYQGNWVDYIVTGSSAGGPNGTVFVDHVNPGNGGGAGNDDGSDTLRNIERLQFLDRVAFLGTSGVDSLVGTAAVDTLYGFAGNDTLNGAGGADNLIGGTGDDIYVVNNAVTITELASGGTADKVESTITLTLANNVENLTLLGAALNGTGNAGNNIITGNGNNNTLTGLGGNDTLNGLGGVDALIGGTGNDTYVVDTTTDTITEASGQGTDTVQSSVTFTLLANVERLSLTGGDAINGTGNSQINVLTGNSNNNTLSGLGGGDTLIGDDGDDTLIGGAQADTLTGGNGADTFTYNLTSESTTAVRDTITDFLSGTDKINLNAIDANTGAGGNQDFVFIGTDVAFGGSAQVRYDSVTGRLQANVNAGLGADFEIQLTAVPALFVTDFIL
ncbi:MAG: peroxidase family protein [Nitrosomonas sp.]